MDHLRGGTHLITREISLSPCLYLCVCLSLPHSILTFSFAEHRDSWSSRRYEGVEGLSGSSSYARVWVVWRVEGRKQGKAGDVGLIRMFLWNGNLDHPLSGTETETVRDNAKTIKDKKMTYLCYDNTILTQG